MPSQNQGKARRGSQFWLQKLTNEAPEILNAAIADAVPVLSDQTIEWVSPLASDRYREYRDQLFLTKLGIELIKRPLAGFWPKGGPVWDGLARTSAGEIVLVEAKSHIPEAVSPPSRASTQSLKLIQSSLDETKHYLNGNSDADWAGIFYQVTNRLAHLYLLRVLNDVPAHLAFLYFIGDRDMNGPQSADVWQGAVRIIERFLGVERTKLSPFVHHVFLDLNRLGVGRD